MRFEMRHGDKGVDCLDEGWSGPEPALTWAIGPASRLTMPVENISRRCLLRLHCWPHVWPGVLERQRVMVMVDGQEVGRFEVRVPAVLVVVIPATALEDAADLEVELHHPDAAAPASLPGRPSADQRALALAYTAVELDELSPAEETLADTVRAALDAPPSRRVEQHLGGVAGREPEGSVVPALGRLQSLGEDCELGFVQRRYKLEPLGVFRFAGIGIDRLATGLDSRLADFARPENLDVIEHPTDAEHDYLGHETLYGVRYHTMRYPSEIERDALQVSETQRLRYLARKFIGDISRGGHLFVVKRKMPLHPEEVARLLLAMRRLGGATLLWVAEADASHPAGAADLIIPGLLRGYVGRFDVAPLKQIDMAGWAEMAYNAVRLWGAIEEEEGKQPFLEKKHQKTW